jgi:ribose 5-phosphate isomerase A
MNLKQQAASRALDFVRSGMVLGLGTGSTTAYFVDLLGERLKAGEYRGLSVSPPLKGLPSVPGRLGSP